MTYIRESMPQKRSRKKRGGRVLSAWKTKSILNSEAERKFKFYDGNVQVSNLWKGNFSVSKGGWILKNRKTSHSPPKRVPCPTNSSEEKDTGKLLKTSQWPPSSDPFQSSDELSASVKWHQILTFKSPSFFRITHWNFFFSFFLAFFSYHHTCWIWRFLG